MQAFQVFGDYVLRGVDAVHRQIDSIDYAAQASSEKITQVGDSLGRLGNSVSSYGDTLTARVTGPLAAISAAAASTVSSLASSSAAIEDNARQAGLGTEAWQEYSYALREVADLSERDTRRAFGRLTQRIGRARDGNEKYTDALRDLGFSQQAIESGLITSEDAFDRLTTRMQQAGSEAEAMAIAGELMGTNLGRKLAIPLRESGDEIDAMRGRAHDLGIVLSDETIAQASEFDATMQTIGDRLRALSFVVAAELLPYAQQFGDWLSTDGLDAAESFAGSITGLIDLFTALPGPVQGAIGVLVGLAAALGPVMSIGGRMISMVGGVIQALSGLSRITMLLGATVSAPFLIAAAAIAGLVAAGVLLVQNWEAISSAAQALWQPIRDAFNRAREAVSSGVTSMLDYLRNLPGRMADGARNAASSFVSGIRGIPGAAIGVMRELASGIGRSLANIGASIRDAALQWARDLVEPVRQAYNTLVGNSIVPDMVVDIRDELKTMESDAGSISRRVSDSLTDGFDGEHGPELSGIDRRQAGNRRGGGGGDTYIDMRHSVMHDDADLRSRVSRSGGDFAGGFA